MITFLISELSIRGGTHKQLLKLVEYVDQKSIKFKIITLILDLNETYPEFRRYEKNIIELSPIDGKWIGTKLLNHFRYINRLKKEIKNSNVINIHDCGFEKYLSAFRGKKVYWQINDLPKFFKEGVAKKQKISLKNKIIKKHLLRNLNIVTEFVVNVSKNADRVSKHFKRKAKVFYPGVDMINFTKLNSNSFHRFSCKKINLLSSGVFFPYRNYEVQIKVVKILKEKGYDVCLRIFGLLKSDPIYSSKIKELVRQENLDANIHILGQINEETYSVLHKDSDIFLFTNIDQSWGLAIFEAMSCGMPVIVSNNVGATEILTDNENSIFINPHDEEQIADKILVLIKKQQFYESISSNSVLFAHDMTWEKSYCSKMLNLLMN